MIKFFFYEFGGSMTSCFDKWVYEKPALENYSAFGVFGAEPGTSGDGETNICSAVDDVTEDDGLGLENETLAQ